MTVLINILAIALLAGGLFFLAVGTLGIIRLPDFYTRMHAQGKTDTLGGILLVAGLMIVRGWQLDTLKLLIILVFIAVANPTATHALSRAAYRSGVPFWRKESRETI